MTEEMEQKEQQEAPLPLVFRRKAEAVLHEAVITIYKTDDASVYKCMVVGGSFKYVDLDRKIEVKRPLPSDETLKQWGNEDTAKLTGGNFANVITRDDLAENASPETATEETTDEVTDDQFAVMQRKPATKKKGAANTRKKK